MDGWMVRSPCGHALKHFPNSWISLTSLCDHLFFIRHLSPSPSKHLEILDKRQLLEGKWDVLILCAFIHHHRKQKSIEKKKKKMNETWKPTRCLATLTCCINMTMKREQLGLCPFGRDWVSVVLWTNTGNLCGNYTSKNCYVQMLCIMAR